MEEGTFVVEDDLSLFKKNLDDLELRLSSKHALIEELDVWIQELFSLQKMIAFQSNSVRKLQSTQAKIACLLIQQIRDQITRADKKDPKTWKEFASISNQIILSRQQMFSNLRRTNSMDDFTEVPNTQTRGKSAFTTSPSEDKEKKNDEEKKRPSSWSFGKLFRSSKSNGTSEPSKITKRNATESTPSEISSKSSSPPATLSASATVPFDKETASARKARAMTISSSDANSSKTELEASRKLKKDGSLSEKRKGLRQALPTSWSAEEEKSLKDEKNFKRWIKKLQKGEIEKKAKQGHLNEEEMDALIEIATGGVPISSSIDSATTQEENKRLACFALAAAAFPVETVGGCRRKLISSGLLEPFLKYAIDNVREDNNTEDVSIPALNVHNDIKESEIEVSKMIAQGASAKVYLAKYKGHEVAVKIFDKNHISFNLKEFKRELFILSVLHNRHFVTCYGGGGLTGKPFIVSEYMSKGPLNEFLKQNFQFIDLLMMLKFVKDISSAMKWLNSLQIIHRDLKSLNILINKDLVCKIIDFGTSRMIDANKTMTGNLGTPAWIAPELFRNEKYTEKADVYSFGIVMWEILTGKEPFYDVAQMWKIPELVLEGKRPTLDATPAIPGSEDYIEIMKLCWDNDPTKRPSFEQLYHAFGRMIKNTTPEGVYQSTSSVKELLTPETVLFY